MSENKAVSTPEERKALIAELSALFFEPANIKLVIVDALEETVFLWDEPECPAKAVQAFIAECFNTVNFADNEDFAQVNAAGRPTKAKAELCKRLYDAYGSDPEVVSLLLKAGHQAFENAALYKELSSCDDAPALLRSIDRAYLLNTMSRKE